jgi:peroxiredoxin family protein
MARELDVKMIACTMSMDAMGIEKEELVDGLEYGGVAAYMADAARSRVTLFI